MQDRSDQNITELEPLARPAKGEWRRVTIISDVNGGEYETETVILVAEKITLIRVEAVE